MKKIIAASIVAAAVSAQGQSTPGVSQSSQSQQLRETQKLVGDLRPGDGVPSLYADEDSDVGPQLVLRQRKHKWFRATVDEQVYYTDNMFFRRDSDIDAGLSVATAEAAIITPPCITSLASYRAEVGYRHQFFNYFGEDEPIVAFTTLRRDDFDFQASTAFAEVLAQTAHYQFRAGFDYTRLLGSEPLRRDDNTEFYREYVPRWSVQRNFRVCDRSQFSVAYLGSYHFADESDFATGGVIGSPIRYPEDRSERWEHAALASWSVALPCHLVAQPYYRFQYTEYTAVPDSSNPSEFLHTAGLAFGWYPCENFSARLFGNYNWNHADAGIREYEQLNVGGGVNVTLRF